MQANFLVVGLTLVSSLMLIEVAGDSLVLLSNGRYDPGGLQIVDVSSSKTCKPIQKYPLDVFAFAGGLLNKRVVICGGVHYSRLMDKYIIAPECYIHDPKFNTWNYLASLKTARVFHTITDLHDRIWVTGGRTSEGRLKTTEFIFPNGNVLQGPDLPEPMAGMNCVVDLLDGRYMIMDQTKSVFIYTSKTGSFVSAPSLLSEFEDKGGCTLFKSPRHGNRWVVMALGYEPHIQVLDYTVPSAVWEKYLVVMPSRNQYDGLGPQIFSYADKIYGVQEETIFRLVCNAHSCTLDSRRELEIAADGGLMAVLPENYSC